jgi:hypothetical protein
MKRLRLLLAISVLTVTFTTVTTMGGQMPGGVTSSPPPPPVEDSTGQMPGGATSTITVTGETGTTAIDPATEFMLNLLQSLFSLL